MLFARSLLDTLLRPSGEGVVDTDGHSEGQVDGGHLGLHGGGRRSIG